MEKGKNSLSPVSHFRHRQVSDPSHGHMDLIGCPYSILAKTEDLFVAQKEKRH